MNEVTRSFIILVIWIVLIGTSLYLYLKTTYQQEVINQLKQDIRDYHDRIEKQRTPSANNPHEEKK
ncbi:MAG: hypothetical protein HDS62_08375 [Bacteroidales bacterium]|nr:hypothetical protein [Bacteroidales bacterium]